MVRKPAALLLVLLALLLMLCAGAWLVLQPGLQALEVVTPGNAYAAAPATPTPEADQPARLVSPRVDELPAVAPAQASGSPAVQPEKQRSQVQSAEELELANAIWLEGRVVFPADTPIGEVVRVVATGRKFKSRGPHSAEVGRDGSFRVAFAEKTRTGWLRIDAPHLYIASKKVNPLKPDGEVVLEPKVGGRIVGRVVLPPGASEVKLTDVEVLLNGFEWDGSEGNQIARSSPLDGELRFELRGVPADLDCSIHCSIEGLARAQLTDIRATAGETLELELPVRLGARVSGRVVDEGGGDLTSARVAVENEDTGSPQMFGVGEGEPVAADGSFDVRGVEPGKLQLRVRMKGRKDVTLPLGDVADGARLQDLAPRLSLGSGVEGQVLWPDGSPAAKARVEALDEIDEESDWSTAQHRTTTDAEGRFRITGLSSGPYKVRAEATDPKAAVGSVLPSRGSRWHALAEEVPSEGPALVLRLQEGFGVRGRVLDDSGVALPAFRIQAQLQENAFGSGGKRVQPFWDTDTFELEGLRAGHWTLTAVAQGHQPAHTSFTLPGDGSEQALALTLVRSAHVAGKVLDGDGRPLAKATVKVELASGGETTEVRSKDGGDFSLPSTPPGRVRVSAESDLWAPSPPIELDVVPGQRIESLVLQLRRGSRITGELSAAFSPQQGRDVYLWGNDFQRQTKSDARGAFEFRGMPPGEYQVGVWEHSNGAATINATKQVVVVEGEDAHVVLGPTAGMIEVSGRVRNKRGPLVGASVSVSSSDGTHIQAQTDASGRYSLHVAGPGEHRFWVHPASGGTATQREVTIESGAKTWSVDFELSGGALRGRVVDPSGKAVRNSQVQLQAQQQGSWGHATSDSEGAFAFEDLADGTYALTASPPWGGNRSQLSPTRREGLEISGEREVSGIELRLERGGSVEGSVRMPDGSPAANVHVTARPEAGHSSSMAITDNTGRYKIDGLSPGSWTLSASDGENLLSDESAPVRIESGGKARQDLLLRNGTVVIVRVLGNDDQPVEAWVSVTFPDGHTEHEHHPPDAPLRAGPFAPGTYRVHIYEKPDTAVEVQVSGEAERSITLKMPPT